jgi:hypothetical protein
LAVAFKPIADVVDPLTEYIGSHVNQIISWPPAQRTPEDSAIAKDPAADE